MWRRVVEQDQVRRHWFDRTEELSRPERVSLLVFVAVLVVMDAVGFVAGSSATPVQRFLSIAVTLAMALYAWSPLAATLTLGTVIGLSFFAGNASDTILAGAFSALFVVRLGTAPLIMGYAGGLLITFALVSMGVGTGSVETVNIGVYLVMAAVTGGVGLALRLAYARGRHLESELAEQAEREREAILAERRWIAGELHDNIAHHLTVISLHAQLLDDEAMRPASQDAIRTASKKVLNDLRFVIRLAEDAPSAGQPALGDLAAAIEEARGEFEAAGHTVVVEGNAKDDAIPRAVDLIFARIVRESATNVLKYAGPGEIQITLEITADSVIITIRSPMPIVARHDVPSSGTGLNRMAERVLGISGEFHAGPDKGFWVVRARLPLAPSAKTPEPPKQ